MSDSSSDTSVEDIISRDQFNNIETYRTSMKKPLVRKHFLNQRIFQAEMKFGELMSNLCDHSVSLTTRVKSLEKNIRTRLCYATGMWNLGQAEMLRLQQVYARFLYRMIGPQITPEPTDDYSFSSDIKNFKEKYSYKIAATTPLCYHLLKLRLEWIAYCLNSGKRNEAKYLLFGENRSQQRMIFENLARDPKIALNRIQLQNKMKAGRDFTVWLESRIKTLSDKWIEQRFC